MTPFVYDTEPFNKDSWNVYGPDRGVVWGCESPELLITESLAFHDRRVKDTKLDGTGKKIGEDENEKTMDQYRIPQGSLFLEFYCPHPRLAKSTDSAANTPLASPELYTIDPVTGDFASTSRERVPDGMPVWQVAISTPHHKPDNLKDSPLIRRTTMPDTTSFQPNLPGIPFPPRPRPRPRSLQVPCPTAA